MCAIRPPSIDQWSLTWIQFSASSQKTVSLPLHMLLGSGRNERKSLLLLFVWASLSQQTPCSYGWDRTWVLSGLLIPIPSSCCRGQTSSFQQHNQGSCHLGSSGENESGSTECKGVTASPFCWRTEFRGWKRQPAQASVCCLMTGGWHRAIVPVLIILHVGRHMNSAGLSYLQRCLGSWLLLISMGRSA